MNKAEIQPPKHEFNIEKVPTKILLLLINSGHIFLGFIDLEVRVKSTLSVSSVWLCIW